MFSEILRFQNCQGFDLANIPPGWKQILDEAKVQKHELQDPVVSKAIINAAASSVPPPRNPSPGMFMQIEFCLTFSSAARKTSQGSAQHVLPDIDHVV